MNSKLVGLVTYSILAVVTAAAVNFGSTVYFTNKLEEQGVLATTPVVAPSTSAERLATANQLLATAKANLEQATETERKANAAYNEINGLRNAAAAMLQKLIDKRDACQRLRLQQLANDTSTGRLITCWTNQGSADIATAQENFDSVDAELAKADLPRRAAELRVESCLTTIDKAEELVRKESYGF